MSSGGHNLMVEEKRMKRKISNRESARRSREKKEQHLKDLNHQIFHFKKKRDEMVMNIKEIVKGYGVMETENMVLRVRKQELEKRLEYAMIECGLYESDGYELMTSMGGLQEPWEQHQPSNLSLSSHLLEYSCTSLC